MISLAISAVALAVSVAALVSCRRSCLEAERRAGVTYGRKWRVLVTRHYPDRQ